MREIISSPQRQTTRGLNILYFNVDTFFFWLWITVTAAGPQCQQISKSTSVPLCMLTLGAIFPVAAMEHPWVSGRWWSVWRNLNAGREKENQKSPETNTMSECLNLNDSFEGAHSGWTRRVVQEGISGRVLLCSAAAPQDLELMQWLQGAQRAGPGTAAPLASPSQALMHQHSLTPSQGSPNPCLGHSTWSLQKGFLLCGISGSLLSKSCLVSPTGFRSAGKTSSGCSMFPSQPPPALLPFPSLPSYPSLHLPRAGFSWSPLRFHNKMALLERWGRQERKRSTKPAARDPSRSCHLHSPQPQELWII